MLEICGLCKKYGSKTAIDDVSFNVAPGEIVAIVGPNGAGKTTLFHYLAGIHGVDCGEVKLDGAALKQQPLSQVGFLDQSPYFYSSFSASEMILFEKAMRSISISQVELNDLISGFKVTSFLNEEMRDLSQGMAKRVALVRAFLGSPAVLILDEPLNNIDIQTVLLLKERLYIAKQHKSHILISSHVLDFLDGLADKIVFLNNGSVVKISSEVDSSAESIYRELFL